MSNRAWRREHYEPSISDQPVHRPKVPSAVGNVPEVLLKIRGLAQGENPVELHFDAGKLDFPAFLGQASIKGTIRREGDRLDLTGAVSATGNLNVPDVQPLFRGKLSRRFRSILCRPA